MYFLKKEWLWINIGFDKKIMAMDSLLLVGNDGWWQSCLLYSLYGWYDYK